MSCPSQFSCKLVDEINNLPGAILQLKAAIAAARRTPPLAVDCEGINLSRDGTLTVVTVATTNQVFIFDVLKLDKSVFDGGLRDILEDTSVDKLMFDCRKDSDALWHLYNVKLDGVVDLQLLEVMGRKYLRRVECRKGYGYVLDTYCKDQSLTAMKTAGHVFAKCSDIWGRRPMTSDMINYCSVDTAPMFQIFAHLQKNMLENNTNGNWKTKVKDASKLFTDYYRKLRKLKHDIYEQNKYLPLNVASFLMGDERSMGSVQCLACGRCVIEEHIVRKSSYCIVCDKISIDQVHSKIISKTGHMIYMQGLARAATIDDVCQFLSPLVPVQVKYCCGREKGHCFVELRTQEDAQAAITKHMEYMGTRYIQVYLK